MSEETTSSATPSESAQPESVAPPSGAPKKKLWLMIAAIAVVAILIGSSVYIMFLAPMRASMKPDEVTVDAGQAADLNVTVKKGIKSLTYNADTKYRWRLDPDTLASFSLKSKPDVTITAGKKGGTGTLTCEITYKGETVTLEKTLTVNPPTLDQIVITPSTKTLDKNMSAVFSAAAFNTVAEPVTGLVFTWSVSGAVSATLNSTSGVSVNLTTGSEYGNVTLSASATSAGVTKTGSAQIIIGALPPRSVDYLWYDMFNVPFGSWWDKRWTTYHIEEPITNSYPYLFNWHGQPPGNLYVYTNMRLNITGRNMTDMNMNERPEFLPLHGTTRGGTAKFDWYLQYLTSDEMKRYPAATAGWDDGWVVSLNGTVSLDKLAATSVLKGLTSSGFDDFSNWWSLHGNEVQNDLTSWIVSETGPNASRPQMDIYPMYDGNFQMLTGQITAAKVGDQVVLTYDLVTWGIECLITRWLHEAFMSNEWYFEDMNFHATIGPERSSVDIDTVVVYAVYAYEVTNTPPSGPEPCWVWESLLQDYVSSSPPETPYSGYDPYMPFEYLNTAPGSDWYNLNMTYDYEPGASNLSAGETLKFVWPQGLQEFKVHVPWNESASGKNTTGTRMDTMYIPYAEPMESDNPALAPGKVTIDNDNNFIEYVGPIDMWSWSKNQNQSNHQWLKSEWDRLGMLPYGAPYIEFWPEHGYTPTIDHFVISDVPRLPVNNTAVSATVTAYDELGKIFSGYNGTVTFSSNRTDVDLPGDYKFTPSDGGRHTFDNLTFRGEEDFRITVASVENPSAQGNYTDIWVIPDPQVPSFDLKVRGVKGIVIQGLTTDVEVTVYNQYPAPHNVFEEYSGTVFFETDAAADTYMLPPNTTFSPLNEGFLVLHGLQFNVSGVYMLKVSDLADPTRNYSVTVRVTPPPDVDYRLYDMFEQPWGDWWPWRLLTYKTDLLLNSKPHEYTMVYNPDGRNMQGIIYAPYRWNVTAMSIPTIDVHHPEFMPILGTPGSPVANAQADLHIRWEYLDNASWYGYWKPTWGTNPNWTSTVDNLMPPAGNSGQYVDGYYIGVLYTVSLNREAAFEWLGMPLADLPATWWAANGASWMSQWQTWIMDEGNVRLDVWPAYEWPYVDLATMSSMVEESNGNITLQIAHMSWGFEALIIRWLNETGVCVHEPYMEDFDMSVHYGESYSNVILDAVAQYSLHAVKANGTVNDAAWIWEPQRMDYVFYENPLSGYNSEFNPWEGLSYTSWNAGDGFFGDPLGVPYDATPQWFNLTDYMTFTIQLPLGDNVIGYMGEGLPTGRTSGAIYLLKMGNASMYENITIHGPMELGYNMTGTQPGAPNLWDYYNPVTKTLTLQGPMNFDNYRWPNGLLYHSAPWIEFNVANLTWGPLTTTTASVEEPTLTSAGSVDALAAEVAMMAVVLCGAMAVIAVISRDLTRKE